MWVRRDTRSRNARFLVVGVGAIGRVAAIGRIGIDVFIDFFLGLFAASCTSACTDCGTSSCANGAAYCATNKATSHGTTGTAGTRASFVVVTFRGVSCSSTTGSADARADSSADGAANCGAHKTAGHSATGTGHGFVTLVVMFHARAIIGAVHGVSRFALYGVTRTLASRSADASADSSARCHSNRSADRAEGSAHCRACGSAACTADCIAYFAFISGSGHTCAGGSTYGSPKANAKRTRHDSTDRCACSCTSQTARSLRGHAVAFASGSRARGAIAVVIVTVERAGVIANIASTVPVEDVEGRLFLAVRNAGCKEHASALHTSLVEASLFFGYAGVNECANEAAGCSANTRTDECRGERTANGQGADAGYGDCANTDQKAGKSAKHAAADGACHDTAAACVRCYGFRCACLCGLHCDANVVRCNPERA
jgi:hypothetical protein